MKKSIAFLLTLAAIVSVLSIGLSSAKYDLKSLTDEELEELSTAIFIEQGIRKSVSTPKVEDVKIPHGKVLEINQPFGSDIIVVKVQIEKQNDKKKTISQNYDNVMNLISDYGFGKYEQVQYWAVMGKEQEKVISFTLYEDISRLFEDGTFSIDLLPDMVDELWISPKFK